MLGNPYASYKRQSVTTLTPIEIVVKLYDECERQMSRAVHFIGSRDYAETNNALMKSIEIVGALRSVLDLDIPMGKDLDALYEFFTRELIDANMKKDAGKLKTLIPLMGELRDAFSQISKMPKEQIHMQAVQNAAASMPAPSAAV